MTNLTPITVIQEESPVIRGNSPASTSYGPLWQWTQTFESTIWAHASAIHANWEHHFISLDQHNSSQITLRQTGKRMDTSVDSEFSRLVAVSNTIDFEFLAGLSLVT